MSNILVRTLSGAVYIAAVIASLLLGQWYFFALILFLLVWGMIEFSTIYGKDAATTFRAIPCFSAIFAFVVLGLHFIGFNVLKLLTLLSPCLLILFLSALYKKTNNAFRALTYALFSIIYVGGGFCSLFALGFFNGNYEADIPLVFFVMLWSSDTFAYLFGRWLGKHKLFERVSPKKTWEGFVGGLVCTVGISIVAAQFSEALPLWHWVAIAVVTVVFGVWGDLIESLLKRSVNIKDSGKFLPGHGGLLDRFDSVIFAAPAVWTYLYFVLN